jgi:16S rRNA processing protein RimM
VQLVVGRIAKAHGIGGEVSVEVRTDAFEERFAVGAALDTEPAHLGPLTIARTRWHAGRLLVAFEGVSDRTLADALRGALLVVDSATSPAIEDADEYWDHDLAGLDVVLTDGQAVGVVADVAHPPGADLLVIRRPDGSEALVPFVRDIVTTVDMAARRVVVDPPDGLFEL